MKLRSLCDMATVPRTPPLGVAEVPLCRNPFLAIVCVFPVRGLAGGSQVLGSCDSALLSSLGRLSKSLISFQTRGGQ